MGIKLSFGIDAWQAWIPALSETAQCATVWQNWPKQDKQAIGLDASEPDVKFVDPMMRRRLSPFGRACLASMHGLLSRCAHEAMPVVFASRHGDLIRTIEMLDTIASHTPISPTNFGLTVHNAVVGMAAILQKNKQPALAMAAGVDTFWFGLCDVVARSQASGQPHLYLYADMPTPAIYQQYADVHDLARVFACIIRPQPTTQIRLEGRVRDAHASDLLSFPSELRFLSDLAQQQAQPFALQGTAVTSQYYWSWTLSEGRDAH